MLLLFLYVRLDSLFAGERHAEGRKSSRDDEELNEPVGGLAELGRRAAQALGECIHVEQVPCGGVLLVDRLQIVGDTVHSRVRQSSEFQKHRQTHELDPREQKVQIFRRHSIS